MPASLRAPDITEEHPDPSLPRAVRLHNMIRFQLRGNDAACLLHWIATPPSGNADELSAGYWVAWLDNPAPQTDPLRQAGVAVPAEFGVTSSPP